MFMCTSLRGQSNCSHSKSEFHMFSLIAGRHVRVPRKDTNTASADTELYIFA